MRKILLAFDGFQFSDAAFDFAKQLNEKNPVLLTGVFLPKVSYANLWSYADGVGAPMFIPPVEDSEDEKIELNIEKFEMLCQKHKIEYRTRKDFTDLALPELKRESRFADLLIIGGDKFYENLGSGEPNNYLREALHKVECSVIIVPEKYTFPTINVLAYDGTASSVFAIKQFAYLLPEFTTNPTLLTYANIEGTNNIPYEAYIEELAARHFTDLTVSKVDIESKKHYAIWLSDKKSAIIVAGSFGRSTISQVLSKSFVSDIINNHSVPIFIGHK